MTESTDSDLKAAIEFVVARVEEQGKRAGEPLDDDERFLLRNLPRTSGGLVCWGPGQSFRLRNFAYEKLCKLTKAAYKDDLETHPTAVVDWNFVAAVARLYRHPLAWLLEWCGVVVAPWWDRLLLFVAGFLVSVGAFCVMLLADRYRVSIVSAPWLWGGLGIIAIALHFALRSFGAWQMKRIVVRLRPVVNVCRIGAVGCVAKNVATFNNLAQFK